MNTIEEIEAAMAKVASYSGPTLYQAFKAEYERLLAIMGNVEGDDILLLAFVAYDNAEMEWCPWFKGDLS